MHAEFGGSWNFEYTHKQLMMASQFILSNRRLHRLDLGTVFPYRDDVHPVAYPLGGIPMLRHIARARATASLHRRKVFSHPWIVLTFSFHCSYIPTRVKSYLSSDDRYSQPVHHGQSQRSTRVTIEMRLFLVRHGESVDNVAGLLSVFPFGHRHVC